MRRALALVAILALVVPGSSRGDAHDPAAYVDPMIGTLGSGFVFPGPAAPYGMVQLSPDTDGYFAYTGYMWIDPHIRGFSHVHVQSMGVPEGGNIPFMPTTGDVSTTDVEAYKSPFTHATEEASAGYYSVLLPKYGVTAELTAGTRVGMHRYTFPPGQRANIMLDIGRQIPGGADTPPQRLPGTNLAHVQMLDATTVVGTANVDRGAEDHYAVHFAARFDRGIDAFGVWPSRGAPVEPADEVTGVGAGAVVTFDAPETPVVVEVGISFVSPENALANLETELAGAHFDFDGLRARTRAAWNDALDVIEVGPGALPTDLRSFTTALYHAQHHPNVFNDANGDYLGYDGAVHRIGAPGDPMPAGSTHYANFSFWDTYRAEMPLLMLIEPDRVRDMMRSLAAIAQQGGRMPRWGLMNRYADFMNGEPGLQVFADAYCRGLVPEESLQTLYDDAIDLALVNRRNPDYLSKGYTEEASATLEHALGDFALALAADRLGETQDRDRLLELSRNWTNVFDEEIGFVRPRNGDGTWMDPYDPMMPEGFREGTGWQYTWLVPHDVAGLYAAMGGDAEARERLDTFFAAALTGTQPWPEVQQKLTLYGIAYYGNQYAPSNEHDLQAPWLYNWTSEPWKTQALQRAYQSLYRAAPDGLPGNDDLGTMSAWFVWSALGLYPVTPGSPTYIVGSPMFERVTMHLPGGDVVLRAPGASAASKFVQSSSLGDRLWLTHQELLEHEEIMFEMGPAPSAWGSGPDAAPPSGSEDLAAFACAG